jgi:hypothetical protein
VSITPDYLETLQRETTAGNPVARTLLINHWLADDNRESITGLLRSIENGGDTVTARFIEAELTCFHGWHGAADWRSLLAHCCEAGHAEAQFVSAIYRDWQALSGDTNATDNPRGDGFGHWQAPAWQPVVAAEGLVVEQANHFAPERLLHFIRANLGRLLQPSAVVDPDSGKPVQHPVRVNRTAQWLPEHLGWTGKLLESRMSEAAGYDPSHGEVFSLLHYRVGEHYKAHYDCLPGDQAGSEAGLLQGGQRVMTVLLTLGDTGFEGGQTWFPRLEAGASPPPGALLRFNNVDEQGQPLRTSLHEGQAITSGEKWLLSKWVRQQDTPYGKEIQLRRH